MIDGAFADYRFDFAAAALYDFTWHEYCDWYLELIKPRLNSDNAQTAGAACSNLVSLFEASLRLLHPVMPFITEELWHGLGFNSELPDEQGARTIQFASWPQPLDADFKKHYGLTPNAEQFANAKYETVSAGRRLRRDFNIASNKRVVFVLQPSSALSDDEAAVLRILLNADRLDLTPSYQPPKGTPTALTPLGELYLPLEGLIDLEAERQRLGKEIAKTETELMTVRKKLANGNFVANAPGEVVAEHRERERNFAERLEQLQQLHNSLA
jgi:valyl-tRNA synthetase